MRTLCTLRSTPLGSIQLRANKHPSGSRNSHQDYCMNR